MEFVYVIKRSDLFPDVTPHGLVTDPAAVSGYVERIRSRGFFVERPHAERDSSFKQVIPYAVVTHGERVLLLRRLATQGEARLHHKLSIGVGGHINPIDGSADLLEAGAERELREELLIDTPISKSPVGVLNDDTSPVGSVHLGLVTRVRASGPAVAVRETTQMEGRWVTREELRSLQRDPGSNFETWSALLLEAVLGWPA
ncbi:MAG: NUDIX domain-containing protein [Planctomycetes bacterium]|nr:NUDIX domain-containing protein [Planctomycetota bacterium]